MLRVHLSGVAEPLLGDKALEPVPVPAQGSIPCTSHLLTTKEMFSHKTSEFDMYVKPSSKSASRRNAVLVRHPDIQPRVIDSEYGMSGAATQGIDPHGLGRLLARDGFPEDMDQGRERALCFIDTWIYFRLACSHPQWKKGRLHFKSFRVWNS